MNRDEQLKIAKNSKSNKEQLREALFASLGVRYEPPDKEKDKSVFSVCKETFFEVYKNYTGLDYSFGIKDGVALSGIIKKIEQITSADVVVTFQAFIWNIPEWYKENAFSLPAINGKFNDIAASIRTNGKGQQQTNGDSLESRLANKYK